MRKLMLIFLVAALAHIASAGALGQSIVGSAAGDKPSSSNALASNTTASNTTVSALGDVTLIDSGSGRLTVKTAAGSSVVVLVDEKTSYLRVPPGEKTLEKAEKILLPDIVVGDRIFARGKSADDKGSVAARQIILMSKTEIVKKHVRDREEWKQNGISGTILAVNAENRELTLDVRGAQNAKPITLVVSDKTEFRRYSPDSVLFADAKPSSFQDIKVGDNLRALVEKSADGARFLAEEVVSGQFRTVAGSVTAVNVEANEIKINLLGSKQSLTVVLNKDSIVRRITNITATMLAAKAQAAKAQAAKASAAGAAPSPGSDDLQDVIEKMPGLVIAQVKQGDVVVVSSTKGADPSRLTAIAFIAGIDVFVNLLQGRNGQRGNSPDPLTGLPPGISDLSIGIP